MVHYFNNRLMLQTFQEVTTFISYLACSVCYQSEICHGKKTWHTEVKSDSGEFTIGVLVHVPICELHGIT